MTQAGRQSPLSWKLTKTQQDCMQTAWTLTAAEALEKNDWQRVKQTPPVPAP
jgi:hypothetical protein